MNPIGRLCRETVGTSLLVLCTSASLVSSASAQGDHAALYGNPTEFAKLSGAMQNLLIAEFGQPPVFDEKGNLVPPPPFTFMPAQSLKMRRSPWDHFQPPASDTTSTIANILVNNALADLTAQDTQSETALVLGAGSNVIAGFNDSGSFLGSNQFTGWAWSSNGGGTWTDPGVLPGGNDAGDPVLARDNTIGRTYLSCLFFSGSGINVFHSDDDGHTWSAPVNGAPDPSGDQDKDWLTVDNFPGAGNGNVYLVVRNFGAGNGVFLFRSTDNGATFGPVGGTLIASAAPNNVQGPYVVVGPAHQVYVFWYDATNSVAPEIRMRRSVDGGITFGAPVTVTPLTSLGINGDLALVGGYRSNSFPCAAVNPVDGTLYVVYNDPSAVSGGDRGNIFLRHSGDDGDTWSAPIRVNDDVTTKAQAFPTMAVRPDGTGLAVCWYDNRNSPSDVNIERWGAAATIAGGVPTFGVNFRISPQFPPSFGGDPVVNFVYMGDYDQMAADNSLYYTTWGDNRDQSIAVPSRKNPNVRFASFGPSGPGAIIDLGTVTISGGNGNGRIEPDECNALTIELRNDGTTTATGISAVLSTSTPGVTVIDASQPYPDLPPGESATNAVPFRIETSPAFACGTTIQFTLTVTTSTGSGPLSFSSATGGTDYIVTEGSDLIVPGVLDIGNHGDDVVTTIALPFPATIYSSSFNSVNLSSNGNAQFSSANTAFGNVCFPTATFSNVIAPHWDDLRTDGSGEGIFTRTTGATPNRVFHIEWRTHYFSGAGTTNFELRLHEGSSQFEVVYGTLGQNAASATIGCQQASGTSFTEFACNVTGSVDSGTMLTFSLPGCPSGGGPCTQCQTLEFGTDDGGVPLLNGQKLTTPPTFGNLVSVSAGGANLGIAVFDSDPFGPNAGTEDDDLLIGKGNILVLQDSAHPHQTVPGFFDTPVDDPDGGNFVFDFTNPSSPRSLVMIDLDPEPNQGAQVTLLDANGKTRTYTVQPGWTGTYGSVPGWKRLDLTTLSSQVGNAPGFRKATVVQMTGYDPDLVTRIVVHMTGLGAIDDLEFCR